VAPIKALLQPTLSPAERDEASIRLKRGDEHPLDELVARWVAMGYRVAPTVEEPGELNRRGGIVDIFPPGDDLPLRIEFFGDEVDSLRRFDPITQRSEAQVREVAVGPAHEIPLWRRERAVERLRALDTSNMRREALDEWESAIERIEQGERFEGRALFAPFFWEEDERRKTKDDRSESSDASSIVLRPSSLIEHLPAGTPVIFSELLLLAQQASEQHHHADERRKLHSEAGELPAGFPRPYLLWDDLLAQAASTALVNLSNNDLEIGDWRIGTGSITSSNTQNPASSTIPPTPFALPDTLFAPPDLFGGQLKRLVDDIVGRLHDGEQIVIVTPQAARVQELVEETLKTKDEGRRTSLPATHRRWSLVVRPWSRCMARWTKAGARPT